MSTQSGKVDQKTIESENSPKQLESGKIALSSQAGLERNRRNYKTQTDGRAWKTVRTKMMSSVSL